MVPDGTLEPIGAANAVLRLLVVARRHQAGDLEGSGPDLIVESNREIDEIT
jgi:hypothetical protein